MKSVFDIILIISFIGVAVFGFISMIYGASHEIGCVASSLIGSAFCPNNILNFITFHIDAFKYFSTAILSIILLILLVMTVFSILPPPLDDEKDDFDDIIFSENNLKQNYNFKKRLIRWLSLCINSPAFVAAAK